MEEDFGQQTLFSILNRLLRSSLVNIYVVFQDKLFFRDLIHYEYQ